MRPGLTLLALFAVLPLRGAGPPAIRFEKGPGRLVVTAGGKPLATYVYDDPRIPRPYFAHLYAPNGVQVSRNYPPKKDDAQDHADMHPGLWLAFGDLGGADSWRLKGRVEPDGLTEMPENGSFTVRHRYLSADGKNARCVENRRLTFLVRPAGYLIVWDSTFKPASDLTLGDQEEMGLGVRVATPLSVKAGKGGRILDSAGRQNEKAIWGKQADWCDYGDRSSGITLMIDPANQRKSWLHVRDYGLMAANPSGPRARGDAKGPDVLKADTPFRLRYGILLRGGDGKTEPDLKSAYADFLMLLADGDKAKE